MCMYECMGLHMNACTRTRARTHMHVRVTQYACLCGFRCRHACTGMIVCSCTRALVHTRSIMDVCMDGGMCQGGWMDGCMHAWLHGWLAAPACSACPASISGCQCALVRAHACRTVRMHNVCSVACVCAYLFERGWGTHVLMYVCVWTGVHVNERERAHACTGMYACAVHVPYVCVCARMRARVGMCARARALMDGWMDGWMNIWMCMRVDGQMDGWKYG